MTRKQWEVVMMTVRLTAEEGMSPTRRRLARELGISLVTLQERVEALRRKGYSHPERREVA